MARYRTETLELPSPVSCGTQAPHRSLLLLSPNLAVFGHSKVKTWLTRRFEIDLMPAAA
jgi:hypothetical protein